MQLSYKGSSGQLASLGHRKLVLHQLTILYTGQREDEH